VITVDGIAASTNVGQPTSCIINATDPADAAPGDMNGNGDVSLLMPGTGSAALPSGLWLATGQPDGTLDHDAINIGQNGNGFSQTDTSPSTFNGTEVISGLFQGSGYNDVMVYQPGSSTCPADIVNDDGQTTPLNPDWASDTVTYGVSETDPSNTNDVTCATSIANGGNLYYAEGDGGNVPLTAPETSYAPASMPDLLTIMTGSLYLVQADGDGTYAPYGSAGAVELSDYNPYCRVQANSTTSTCTATNGNSWAGWTLTSINTPSDIPALFAYNTSLDLVYYYSPAALAALVYESFQGNAGPSPVQLSGITPGAYLGLQATMVDGTPGLYATDVVPLGT
jgi:hypothetical protein